MLKLCLYALFSLPSSISSHSGVVGQRLSWSARLVSGWLTWAVVGKTSERSTHLSRWSCVGQQTMVWKDGIAYFLTHVRPLCSRGGLNKGVPKGTWEEDLEKICTLNKLKSKRFLASDMRSYRNCKQQLNQQSWYELQGKCIRTCTSDKLIIRKCKVALSDESVWAFRHHNPLVILISCARTAVCILPYVSTRASLDDFILQNEVL